MKRTAIALAGSLLLGVGATQVVSAQTGGAKPAPVTTPGASTVADDKPSVFVAKAAIVVDKIGVPAEKTAVPAAKEALAGALEKATATGLGAAGAAKAGPALAAK